MRLANCLKGQQQEDKMLGVDDSLQEILRKNQAGLPGRCPIVYYEAYLLHEREGFKTSLKILLVPEFSRNALVK
jgi:hypothetical protein